MRLHFAEIYWAEEGKRIFDVTANGTTLLTDFDIFVEAGGQNSAVAREFTVAADVDGVISLEFISTVDNAKVSGIEVLAPVEPAIEVGSIEINNKWTSVQFASPIENPIVALGVLSFNGEQSAPVIIRNVTENGFEARVNEWDYLDGSHADETVSYIAMSEGAHTINGLKFQAMAVEANGETQNFSFPEAFDLQPVVLGTVASENNTTPVIARFNTVGTESLTMKLYKEEALRGTEVEDTVHIIAVEPGVGNNSSIEAGITDNTMTHEMSTITFTHEFAQPAVFGAIHSHDGADPAVLRMDTKTQTSTSVDTFIQEEQSKDEEILHTTETIGWFVIDLVE